jgi:hypothetical protein
MTEFVASNGIRVYLDESRSVQWDGSVHGERKDKITQAFREFFQHERDTELGRWRSKEHPEYVAYPQDDENYGVIVVDESGSCNRDYVSVNMAAGSGPAPRIMAVAREFFAAHPEPKPWHNAKPGEVWVLTLDGDNEQGAVVSNDGEFTMRDSLGYKTPRALSDIGRITAGRRIWPEVSE